MADKILLLGHGKDACLALAKALVTFGFHPTAGNWNNFSPRSFGRHDRPRLVLADVDNPHARPMEEFSKELRRVWGKNFPIVAVSSVRKFQEISVLLDNGASDFLPKSASAGLLERKIVRCLAAAAMTAPISDALAEEVPGNLLDVFIGNNGLRRLEDLADVYAGATPRRTTWRRMAPPDQDWKGVLTSDVVERFHVGKLASYLSWNRIHLFRLPPPREYAVSEKVLLCRAGPPLAAAVDRSRLPAGTDVYAVVPREGVSAGYLACIFNSRLMDFYFNRVARLGSDGRLRLEDIREAPMPRPTAAANQELARAAALLSHFGPNPQGWIDRQSREEVAEHMENAIFGLYGADHEVRQGLAAMHF